MSQTITPMVFVLPNFRFLRVCLGDNCAFQRIQLFFLGSSTDLITIGQSFRHCRYRDTQCFGDITDSYFRHGYNKSPNLQNYISNKED